MENEGTYVLSIGGFDPSGGAGILADIKTFEAHKVRGLGVLSALTVQNDIHFRSMRWLGLEEILDQIHILTERFSISVVKTGIIERIEVLESIINVFKSSNASPLFVWDPVVKATAGYDFHKGFQKDHLHQVLRQTDLITPNVDEIKFLTGTDNPMEAAAGLSSYCQVLLKEDTMKKNQEPTIFLTMEVIRSCPLHREKCTRNMAQAVCFHRPLLPNLPWAMTCLPHVKREKTILKII